MRLRPAIILLLFLSLSVGIVEAGEQVTLSPDGGHSNQKQISKALENRDVYLKAGTYDVDGTIVMQSNRVLSGDSDAIIRVYSGSSQWFTGLTGGIISCKDVVHDVDIYGFQIDGNIGNLPSSYANSRSDTSHDCEKLIILHGYSTQFASNIKIHDLKLYNSFSDGCYILFGENIAVYNNFISNCQHEGVYLSCVKYGSLYNNKIAGITSDCGRLDNCVNCKVYNNLFFSYTGESYGATKNWEAGLQIADAGSSKGYDASNKPLHTTNIEVCNNTFADPGRMAIWLDSTGKGYENVYIHDNEFVNSEVLETMGIPVGDISFDNQPTVEMSEKVFSSIFDILNRKFTFRYLNHETDINASVDVVEYDNTYNPHSLVYVNGTDLTSVKYVYNGKTTTHYLTLQDENTTSSTDIWKGDLENRGNAIYVDGIFDKSKLKITCYNTKGYKKITDFNVTTINDSSGQILNPGLWSFIGTLIILGISIFRNLRRIIRW